MTCAHFHLTAAITLPMPKSITYNDSMGVQNIHFFDGVDTAFTIGKNTENITLSGIDECTSIYCISITQKYTDLFDLMELGTEFTISGFNNAIDATYVIEDFTYTKSFDDYLTIKYSLTLEKVRS